MEAVANLLAKSDAGDTCDGRDFKAAMEELHALGWRRNVDRPEPAPMSVTHKDTIYPWWIDPVTGEEILGSRNMMQVAFERFLEGFAEAAPSRRNT